MDQVRARQAPKLKGRTEKKHNHLHHPQYTQPKELAKRECKLNPRYAVCPEAEDEKTHTWVLHNHDAQHTTQRESGARGRNVRMLNSSELSF